MLGFSADKTHIGNFLGVRFIAHFLIDVPHAGGRIAAADENMVGVVRVVKFPFEIALWVKQKQNIRASQVLHDAAGNRVQHVGLAASAGAIEKQMPREHLFIKDEGASICQRQGENRCFLRINRRLVIQNIFAEQNFALCVGNVRIGFVNVVRLGEIVHGASVLSYSMP